MPVKSPFLSKTIWVNSIAALLMAIVPFVPALSGVQAWIQANTSLIGTIWAGLNIALRFITHEKIQLVD